MEEVFRLILIVIGFAVVAYVIYLPYIFGQQGLNNKQDEYDEKLTFNTTETTNEIISRGVKGVGAWLIAGVVLAIMGSNTEQDTLTDIFGSSVNAVVLLLPPIISYIAGLVTAYKASKERKDKGVDELREVLSKSKYLLGGRLGHFQYFHVEKYPKLYYQPVVPSSKEFFKDAQEGDLVYFFRLPINKFRLGKTSSLVFIYRKKDKQVINAGYAGDAIIEFKH